MDINGIRLKRYNQLLREFMQRPDQSMLPNHGLLQRFAQGCGVSARYLSHINNGRKNIGDATARQLEKGNGKPFGWLDHENDLPVVTLESDTSDTETEMLATALKLFRASPVEFQAALIRFMFERKPGSPTTS